jgi:ubiquinone/menaquinone biosynthesis C-methylase UbiE
MQHCYLSSADLGSSEAWVRGDSQAREKTNGLEVGGRVTFKVSDAQVPDLFAPESFDTVLCSSAALYMADPAKAAGTFRGWLKEQGCFVFNTPKVSCLLISWYIAAISDTSRSVLDPTMALHVPLTC